MFFWILISKIDSKTKTWWFMHYVFKLIINIPVPKHEGRELSDKHIFNGEGPLIHLRLHCIVNTGDVSFQSLILWWVQCVSKNRISLCREKWLSLVDTTNLQSRSVFKFGRLKYIDIINKTWNKMLTWFIIQFACPFYIKKSIRFNSISFIRISLKQYRATV